MKKYYLPTSFNFKNKLFLISASLFVILILIIVLYLMFAPKNQTSKTSYYQPSQNVLDKRFLVLYGKITKINQNSLDIKVIKDSALTDSIFDDIKNINLMIESSSTIKMFDMDKKAYTDLSFGEIQEDSFVTAYINNATSSGFKAVGIKVFTRDII